jgi:type I restriction enzyme, S subunit
MNAERLLTHYERIADAPDAIARLRRFILDLAVRGKLVPQDRKDEPAAELLKRIAKEKARLLKAGEIRREKPLPDIEPAEIPYDAPTGWEWVRIRKVTSDHGHTVPERDFTYIDVTAINKENGSIEDAKVTAAHEAPSRARKIVHKGDVLYSCVRPYLLNVAIVENEISPHPIASTAFAVLNGFGLVHPRYKWIVLRSPFMVTCVERKMRGQAYPAINDGDFALLAFPLPPLGEQRRIVAKVDELMALCDRLETARAEREATRDRLAAASLARLNVPDSDPAIFANDARFVLNVLEAISARPDQVKRLQQTILNLAVRGTLSAAGAWQSAPTKLGDVATLQNGYAFKSEWFSKSGTRLLRNANVGHGVLNWDEEVHLPESWIHEFERFRLIEGDVVLSLDRPFIVTGTKVARVTAKDLPALLLQRVGRFILSSLLVPEYVLLWVNSPHFSEQIDPGRSNGVPHISSKQVEAAVLYLPPLAEQHRIVAKVDALMSLCKRLEVSLGAGDNIRNRLLDSLLAEALVRGDDALPAEATKVAAHG